MDRLNQIRGDAGDSTLDTSSPPSEAYMTANESSTKFFSLSEVDSTFSISPSKDSAAAAADSERTIAEPTGIISNLSPIPKSEIDTFKIGKHIEAANILSGGVNIFEDNDNSYDGDELVIDDNVVPEEEKAELKLREEAAVPLEKDTESLIESMDETLTEGLEDSEAIPSKDTEVVLQIDGKNVDAIDIGNGLYLYRKSGEKELSAVQIIDDDQQQPSFKFLKVRENAEGNLEVYEEIQIEIPKEEPTKEGSSKEKTHMPIKDINKAINEPSCNKVSEKVKKSPKIDSNSFSTLPELVETQESKAEVNLNGKMMKFSESRKSPLTFTPMTFHSTPNKEGIPLTKTMVDQHLHPSRHSDNIKKTIEVHTDKPKAVETPIKTKESNDSAKSHEASTSVIQVDDSNNQITIVETSQRGTESVKQDLSEEANKFSGHDTEQNENPKDLIDSKAISDEKGCTIETQEKISMVAEETVPCEKEISEKNERSEEKQNNTLTTQSLTAKKASEELKQSPNELKGNAIEKPSQNPKQNVDYESTDDVIDPRKKEKVKDHPEPKSAENLIISEISMNNEKKNILSHEITSENKVDDLQLNSKINDSGQCKDLIIEPTSTMQSELPSIVELKTNRDNAVENVNLEAAKTDLPTINKPTIDCCTSNIADGKCDKDAIENSHISSKMNTETKHESYKPEVDITLSEKSKINDLNAPTHPFMESQIKPSIYNKDNMDVKVQADSIKSSAPQVKLDIESQSTSKAAVEYSKIINKVKDIQQPAALSLATNQKGNNESKSITKPTEDPSKVISKDTSIAPASLSKLIKQVETKKDAPKTKAIPKPNNCNSGVPFGKWTEANRQEFLNKIKETKIPTNNSNQIKQTNDLNRRDVLKKFDTQRQSNATVTTKISEFGSAPKLSSKMETGAFVNKSVAVQQPISVKPVIPPVKSQPGLFMPNTAVPKKAHKEEGNEIEQKEMSIVINSQELINNTIEGIITRALKNKTTAPVHMKEKMTIHTVENPKDAAPLPGSLDDIEMKMNELHGFSFMERAVTELSQTVNHDIKQHCQTESINSNKNCKIPCLLPFKAKEQQKTARESMRDDTSDEEIIEHEPITGDIDVSKTNLISLLSCKETFTDPKTDAKKDAIITEKDFDKFARRNSKTYENCLTVNFDKEKHKVVQTVVEKETSVKKLSRNELMLAESKAKSTNKHHTSRQLSQTSKIPTLKSAHEEDSYNKNYQSKVQMAYQSALTAKRNLESPIPIIEEKPVVVLFTDTNTEYTPAQLNVQGKELSPLKNPKSDSDVHSASESLDSDVLDSSQDAKPQDEKSKKHQRKQVLTPVEEPEMQLIEPSDLGIKVSPTKKRKIEEKPDRTFKNLVPKKSYLLNRSVVEHTTKSDQSKPEGFTGHVHSALDNLVKAAELIENQSETNKTVTSQTSTSAISQSTETPLNTPVKRGRGRPRKYPLPEPDTEPNKTPSPQKKPRLIDAKPVKTYSDSEESSDGEIVKENWTMGKINENIVCPICSKLFRSEDVLFKHVKHCTGPSPNRSDSDKRSPRRLRNSQESERKLRDSMSDSTDNSDAEGEKEQEDVKIKSRGSISRTTTDVEDVIVIEDTPVKHKPDAKAHYSGAKRGRKPKYPVQSLICEFCGKTFRQLSYLDSHKLQHKNDNLKEVKNGEGETLKKSVFSCEVCAKEFRKLHHLVQHRIIHNPSSMASRSLRKTSSEIHESKNSKSQNDDASAGFRCEPCDKSFRKLHHLVEHRETHDGINKKGNTSTAQAAPESTKSMLAHHCDICKKVFKKLQDLLDHKEQHYETGSEKSDDKSVKSSLSTKDIIHECSLCYMVFPNEHSLNKHTVICLRKKKQSAAKQAAKQVEVKEGEEASENIKSDEDGPQDIETVTDVHPIEDSEVPKNTTVSEVKPDQAEEQLSDTKDDVEEVLEVTKHNVDTKPSVDAVPKKRHSNASEKSKADDVETPAKIKKVDIKERVINLDTPTLKKKTNKDKIPPTLTKRHQKNEPTPVADSVKPMESSDDDEIRYMLNPNYKEEESNENKVFMKIRALKRNSLQIERPNFNDLVKRRTSLQHPPKMPRLKAKPVEIRPRPDQAKAKAIEKKLTPVVEQSTDSDDSDVKYSFPERETKNVEKKIKRQSVGAKRKSLVGIAKRKSLGKLGTPKGRPKKRTADIEHRCDCGQLFSSAALLSRHTTLAHTPPRIRRRRSPPPDANANVKYANTKPTTSKPTLIKPTDTKPKPKPDVTNSNKNLGVATRKSSVSNTNTENKSDSKSVRRRSIKSLGSAKAVAAGDKKKLDKKK